jgi:hypothetical protein
MRAEPRPLDRVFVSFKLAADFAEVLECLLIEQLPLCLWTRKARLLNRSAPLRVPISSLAYESPKRTKTLPAARRRIEDFTADC